MTKKSPAQPKRKCFWCGKNLRKETVAGLLGFATTNYYCTHCHPKSKRK